ncbi:MAG: AAA family ATPase [Thermodesulfobacteriota bacterium]
MILLPGYEILDPTENPDASDRFYARHIRTDQPAAFQFFPVDWQQRPDHDALLSFYAALASVDSPHVVPVHAVKKIEDGSRTGILIVSDPVEGRRLAEEYENRRADLENSLEIAVQLAAAVNDLHKAGVVHHGLTGDTVRLHAESGRVIVNGFAPPEILPGPLTDQQQENMPAAFLPYLSPEQTGRMNRSADFRTDFYSMGIVLYALFTGKPPFCEGGAKEIIHGHIAQKPVPPAQIRPEIPGPVSDIVMRLMEKPPESRYQSAYGIRADLARCLEQLKSAGHLDSAFSPGRHDAPETLILSDALYGRQDPLRTLCQEFERVCEGKAGIVMISGYPGVGKTRLVESFKSYVMENEGYFITGRFEQLQQNIPYSAFIDAFGRMIGQILTESAGQVEAWRKRLLSALGANADIITTIIPELQYIIGTPAEVAELSPADAENRFTLTFDKFFRAFGTPAHPLVIFIDNMQWADSASLEQMATFFTKSPARHILFIGAYRQNETAANHPLPAAIEHIQHHGTPVVPIALENMGREDVGRLIAASLKKTETDVSGLSGLIYEKTGGNPFFVKQFIAELYAENLLRYRFETGCWQWDTEGIRGRAMARNVVAFMAEKIRTLPDSTQTTLQIAACIGNRFDLQRLCAVSEKPLIDTVFDLWTAVDKGFISVSKPGYHLLHNLLIRHMPPMSGDAGARIATPENIRFDFQHDKLRQTLYTGIDEEEKQQRHVDIGRHLLAKTPPDQIPNRIFEIVNHFNAGTSKIPDPKEQTRIARLNQQAGQQAMAARAYTQALTYFETGESLLPEAAWQTHYPRMYALVKGQMECHYLDLNPDRAETLSRVLLRHAETDEDRAEIYRLKMIMLASRAEHDEAIRMGITGLRLLGVHLTGRSIRISVLKQMMTAKRHLKHYDMDQLLALPQMDDRRRLLAMNILIHLCFSAFLRSPYFAITASLQVIDFTLKYGNSPAAPFGYMIYGAATCAIFKNHDTGKQFGDLAFRANEAFGSPALTPKLLLFYGSGISIWCEPIQKGLAHHQQGIKSALETGDTNYAVYHIQSVIIFRMASGAPLDSVEDECRRYHEFVRNSGDAGALNYLISARQFVRCLTGKTAHGHTMEDADFAEARHCSNMEKDAIPVILLRHHLLKLRLHYIMGDRQKALQAGAKVKKLLHYHLGTIIVPEFYFFFALATAAAYADAAKPRQRIYRRRIQRCRDKLGAMARQCPENFRHKHLLVAAELEKLSGRGMAAMSLYHQAAKSARENGFIHIYAIASELAGAFYLHQQFDENARTCLTAARDAYRKWGAFAKAESLETRFPEVSGGRLPDKTMSTFDPIDFAAIVEALQAISTQIVPADLLNKLMQIVLETAGATLTRFFTVKAERLYLEAEHGVHFSSARIYNGIAADSRIEQFFPVLHYVRRTGRLMVIDDAVEHRDFADHAYVKTHQPRSVLCLPVIRQNRFVAVLYMENHMAPAVFTPSRIEVLQLIASQAAISLENARLYENVTANEKQLREVTRQREADSLRYQAQLRSLSSELSLAEERERRRLATQLHDRIGHALTTASMKLRLLQNQNNGDAESAGITEDIYGLIEQSIADTQSLTFELSPPILYDLGLEAALDWLAEQTRARHPITVSIIDDMQDKPLDESFRVLLFQAARELLFNVVKHAGATAVTISIAREGEQIRLAIEDDGVGFNPEAPESSSKKGGFGLFSIRERLAHQGGRLEINSTRGSGCRITMISPMKPHDNS